MNSLRRKLRNGNDGQGEDMIVTHIGIGYQMIRIESVS
jgi:DNA-binding response OmpR family regulator